MRMQPVPAEIFQLGCNPRSQDSQIQEMEMTRSRADRANRSDRALQETCSNIYVNRVLSDFAGCQHPTNCPKNVHTISTPTQAPIAVLGQYRYHLLNIRHFFIIALTLLKRMVA